MPIVDLLKLVFVAVGTFFGIFGILAKAPSVPASKKKGAKAKRGWSTLSKRARISLVSLTVGFLGTFVTTLVSQREERKREVRRAELHRIDEGNVQYSIRSLDSISSRLLDVQRATDQLIYPVDSAIVAFTVEYTLSELDPEALRELERFAEEQTDKWMWYPSTYENLRTLLHDHPLINAHMFDYTFALYVSSEPNIHALDKEEYIFKMDDLFFGECIREHVEMNAEKLSIQLEYRPHFQRGTQSLLHGASASTLAGNHVYFFLKPGRSDVDHTGYTFRLAENTIRLESWRAGFQITMPMEPLRPEYGTGPDFPYRYHMRMPDSPAEYIEPYR